MRTGDFKESYGELVALTDSPPVWLWSLLLVIALILAPYLLNSYALSFLTIILITVIGALGLNILTGYTGLISLGHVGFLVTGAYAYAVVVSKYGMPPIVGFFAAGLVPALLIGFLVLHVYLFRRAGLHGCRVGIGTTTRNLAARVQGRLQKLGVHPGHADHIAGVDGVGPQRGLVDGRNTPDRPTDG